MINVSKAIVTDDSAIMIIDDSVADVIEAYINNNGIDIDTIQVMNQDLGTYWGYDFDYMLDAMETWHYSEDTIRELTTTREQLKAEYPNNKFRIMILSISEELIWNADDNSEYTVAWRYLNHAIALLKFMFDLATKNQLL